MKAVIKICTVLSIVMSTIASIAFSQGGMTTEYQNVPPSKLTGTYSKRFSGSEDSYVQRATTEDGKETFLKLPCCSAPYLFVEKGNQEGRSVEYAYQANSFYVKVETGKSLPELKDWISKTSPESIKQISEDRIRITYDVASLEEVHILKNWLTTECPHLDAIQNEPLFFQDTIPVVGNTVIFPSDNTFDEQWSMDNDGSLGAAWTSDADIDAPEAWFIQDNASGVKVGIVDSGIDTTHPEFSGIITYTKNVIDNTTNVSASNGHGTAVAGIIAANWDSSGSGQDMAGIAPDVDLYVVKAETTLLTFPDSYLAAGISDLASQGCKIINLSVGADLPGGGYSLTHSQITNNSGITFVCSAGNDASTTSTYAPAGWSDGNIISVGGSTGNDIRAYGSNYNQTTVDLFAPSGLFLLGYSGDFVTCGGIYPACDWTTNSVDLSKVSYGIFTTTINGGYTNTFSGTSAAAPHVTGAVALVSKYFNTTSPSEIKSRILNSVDVKSSLDNYCVTEGRLNLRRALSVFSDMATANGWRDVQGAPNCPDFG